MSSSRKILLTRLNLESRTSFDGIDNVPHQNKWTNKQTKKHQWNSSITYVGL